MFIVIKGKHQAVEQARQQIQELIDSVTVCILLILNYKAEYLLSTKNIILCYLLTSKDALLIYKLFSISRGEMMVELIWEGEEEEVVREVTVLVAIVIQMNTEVGIDDQVDRCKIKSKRHLLFHHRNAEL